MRRFGLDNVFNLELNGKESKHFLGLNNNNVKQVNQRHVNQRHATESHITTTQVNVTASSHSQYFLTGQILSRMMKVYLINLCHFHLSNLKICYFIQNTN